MSRKIFLSFLGTSIYKETNYISEAKMEAEIIPTRFIQEAVARDFCSDFKKEDEIIILTTKGALSNWEEREHYDNRNKETVIYTPLIERLKNLNLRCSVKNIKIKDGKSPEELWEIFTEVFNLLRENDEVFFDITHGFRTLPMFNMVLINYAKLLKNISVKGIYYGAFEASYHSNGKQFSPIWNLADFDLLQEWTNNANVFFKTGNAIPLASLIIDDKHVEIKTELENFSKSILVNRGVDIFQGNTTLNLKKALYNYEVEKQNSPLNPIIKKVKHEFDSYESNSSINGFLAARWAIKNGLIQQAATLLEESVTSLVMEQIGQLQFLNDSVKRTSVSAAFTLGNNSPFSFVNPDEIPQGVQNYQEKYNQAVENLHWQKVFIQQVRDLPFKKKLSRCLNDIKNSIRNDINHAGFRENPRTYEELERSISKRYKELKKVLKQELSIEIPEL